MGDWLSKEQRHRNMSAIRSTGTKPEDRLEEMLRRILPRHKIVRDATDLIGKPDFVIPRLQLALFVDGCFWHQCPWHGRVPDSNRDYWVSKLARNVERDRLRRRTLRDQGYAVWRVWEHRLKRKALDETGRRLESRLKARRDARP